MNSFPLRFLLLCAAAVLLQCAWLSPSQAQPKKKPTLVVFQVDSDNLAAAEKNDLVRSMKMTIARYKRYALLETPEIDFLDEMVNHECLEMDLDCLCAIAGTFQADFALYTQWDGSKLSVFLVNVKKKEKVQRFEKAVSEADLAAELQEPIIVKALGPIPVHAPKLIGIKIEANEDGAEVFINQTRVGTTPYEGKLKPGSYVVSVRKKDFIMVEKKFKIVADPISWNAELKPMPKEKTEVVVVDPDKTPEGEEDDEDDSAFYETWWFWTAVGVVTAGAVAGTVFALTGDTSGAEVGNVKFSISPSAAEKDGVFYE